MSGKVISTVEMTETVTAGKDENMELKVEKKDTEKNPNNDFPMETIDQSKTVSTRNMVPNKRVLTLRDVHKFVRQNLKPPKPTKKTVVKKAEKKKGRPKKEMETKE